MSQSTIDEILRRKEAERSQSQSSPAEEAEGKFFSILLGEGLHEHFLELQFQDGTRTCFSYQDLGWFNYFPEDGIDLDFGGYLISIKGRGLVPRLFNGLKQKRVAWVKEADFAMQDHEGNECFISEIVIMPPKGFAGEEEEPADGGE